MKIIIISISFAALFSCNKNEKPAIHITEDAYLKKYEQIPSTSLSKISLNSYIDLDTIVLWSFCF